MSADPLSSVRAGVPSASPQQWQQVFALLDTALEIEPAAQPQWLASLPPEQRDLTPLLVHLLQARAEVETGNFLQAPPTFAFVERGAPAALAADTRIGPYRLLREIGQGGMASVWLAERADGLLERRVALKLPHASWGAASFADRMARERNILASLTHPNIARLYDAGLADDGRPFLALEYVEGEAIDAHATTKGLAVRARVELAVQVARAVAHAHAQLVVHRDLKPSNILVDAAGQAHLLDFGIAKLIDPLADDNGTPQATQAAGRALTPDYASPEQIRGDAIGTASDIYSLGVVMFQLLADARPYRLDMGLGAVALADAIERVRVPRASEAAIDPVVKRQLAGDLDAILVRALAKASHERYATMDALADDLERHLRGEPVKARPDGWWYHTERWVRRHKLETAVGLSILVAVPAGAIAQAAVLVAIGAGAAVALWQMRVARRQTQAARSEATHAEEVKAFVLSIFHAASTDEGAGAATTAVDLLKSAQQRIDAELAGRPETAVELMTAIGQGLFGLGELAAADTVLGRAVALAGRELGAGHRHMPLARVVHAGVLLELDRPKEAIVLLVPAIAEARRQRQMSVLVDGLRWLGSAKLRVGEIEAGLAASRAAVQALEEATRAGATIDARDAMSVWVSLASALNVAEQPGVADAARRALGHAKAVYGDSFNEALLTVRMMLAKGMTAEGQDAQAIAELDAVLDETVRFFGPTYPRIEAIHNYRGHARLDSGDPAGAVQAFRMQLAFAEQRVGGAGANLGHAHGALAKALTAQRAHDEALAHCDTGVRVMREAFGEGSLHPTRAQSLRMLLLTRLGRLDDARRDAELIAAAIQALDAVDRAIHAGRLSALCRLQGRHDEAIEFGHAAVEGLHAHPAKIVRATASAALGSALLAAGRAAEALEPLREAVRLFAEKQLAVSPDQADARAELARAEAVLSPPSF